MSNSIGPIRRFYSRITGKAIVSAVDSSNDVIVADLDEKGIPTSAQNRIPLKEFNQKMKDEGMEADTNTSGFTMFGGKIVSAEKPDHLDPY